MKKIISMVFVAVVALSGIFAQAKLDPGLIAGYTYKGGPNYFIQRNTIDTGEWKKLASHCATLEIPFNKVTNDKLFTYDFIGLDGGYLTLTNKPFSNCMSGVTLEAFYGKCWEFNNRIGFLAKVGFNFSELKDRLDDVNVRVDYISAPIAGDFHVILGQCLSLSIGIQLDSIAVYFPSDKETVENNISKTEDMNNFFGLFCNEQIIMSAKIRM